MSSGFIPRSRLAIYICAVFFAIPAFTGAQTYTNGATESSYTGGTQSPQPRTSPSPGPLKAVSTQDAFIRALDGKPAWLLLSHADSAKEEGRYDQAILYLRGALESSYGRDEFNEGLKHSLEIVNEALEPDAHRFLTPYMKADSHSKVPEKLIYFFLRDTKTDSATGLTRASFEMRTYTDTIPPEKLWNYFLDKAMNLLEQQMAGLFPKNHLRYFDISGRRFAEGYFNSEYPEVIPEVNYELGLLYKDTQDYILAERYLKNAIDQGQYFTIPEKVFAAKYALTDMFRVRGQTFAYQYETTLKSLVAEESAWATPSGPEQKQREQMRKLFMEDPQSLDRVLKLFRLQDGYSRDAHRLLGIYYLQRRNYEEALPHLLFASVQIASKTIEEIRKLNYGYDFTTLSALFEESRNYPEISEYLKSSSFYEVLFALSETAIGYRPNFTRPSRAIWLVLSQNTDAGEYRDRSQALLNIK